MADDLESHLLLYHTGRSRDSAQIIEKQIASTQEGSGMALEAMHELRRAADTMKEALLRGRVRAVLDVLGESWHAKKRAAKEITNPHIDRIAETAMAAGARGLKISGAGGGGFMMIAVEPARRFEVMRALEPLGGRFFSFTFAHWSASAGAALRSMIGFHFADSSRLRAMNSRCASGTSSSAKIASTGHSGTHRVQSMHSSGSITSMFGPSRKQSTGQTSTQSVYLHLMHDSVTT